MRIQLPEWTEPLFMPKRYKVAYGGRGGSKSWSFARALIILSLQKQLRILCTRELQVSISDSVHKLLSDQIEAMGLSEYFIIQQTCIYAVNGSEFFFAGLRNNITKIKSFEGIDIVWCEEAEKISENSWQVLIPTIRKEGSEIWVSFNPDLESDPTFKRFIKNPPPDCLCIPVGWQDNPWLPEELQREMVYLASVDPEAYAHVWGGGCRMNSNAQVLRGKYVMQSFSPDSTWNGPYFGADWGFANDPTTLVKCWINGTKLFIEKEVYKVGLEIDKTPAAFDLVSDARLHTIRADNARPETIRYMQRNGYSNMLGCEKWKGSVEDGIAILRGFEQIIIHSDCIHTAEEARLWSYRVDPLSGDILPVLKEGNEHCWDAIRYALQPIIKGSGAGMLDYLKSKYDEKKAAEEAEKQKVAA